MSKLPLQKCNFFSTLLQLNFYCLESLFLYVGHNQKNIYWPFEKKNNLGRKCSWKNSLQAILRFLVLTRYGLNLKILTMLYLLLSHVTQHTLLPAAKHGLSPFEKCKLSDFIEITLSRVIFRETSQETKNKCYCKKKKSTTIFHGLFS